MAACGHHAILLITRAVKGTSTSVARERVELSCTLDASHDGDHFNAARSVSWTGGSGERPTILRHEDEDGSAKDGA